jgi:hypothetical protein
MKSLLLMILCVVLAGCTDQTERSPIEYSLYFNNKSTSAVTVKAFFQGNLAFEDVIPSNQTSDRSFYVSEVFMGFRTWDSIVLTFQNDKGYICTSHNIPTSSNGQCLQGRENILFTTTDFVMEDNSYYYSITEEDYQNAFQLN